ncbi:hypothetical protein JKF63_07231 [Porcisia hertigi]|uniref:C-type lectin n=1 Tax=Porcisia hertigi TaxID=2761500 RepID=A0A837AY71_9TRYP|nr:hypothetical protein JKF63_07231 [Porcisia hertigi]
MRLPPSFSCGGCTHTPPRRPAVLCTLYLVALTLVVCTTTSTLAFIYTATPAAAQLPASYAATDSGNSPLQGLYAACNQQASGMSDHMLLTVRGEVTNVLRKAASGGVLYLGGYYDPVSDTWKWWDGRFGGYTFAIGPTGKLFSTQHGGWAPGYPQLNADGSVGSLRYVAFDGSRMGWTNVGGAEALNGVACESRDEMMKTSNKHFPWWAIFIIVIAVVAVMTVVLFCCCFFCRNSNNKPHPYYSEHGDFTHRGAAASSHGNSLGSSSATSSLSSREMSYSPSSSSGASSKSFTSDNSGTRRSRDRDDCDWSFSETP